MLGWAAADFSKRGIESARLDAELLLGQVLGLDRIHLIMESERPLEARELAEYRDLIKRRRTFEPVSYILGEREFYGRPFRVDSRVMIPRADTETLVDVALERSGRESLNGDALDLCTGSGCVATTLARERPTWRVTGIDLSDSAVTLARENAMRLGAVWGVRFLVSDLTAALGPEERFDLVTANPPYIPTAEVERLDATVRDFEPRTSLDGGPDGFAILRRVVEQGVARLRPSGVLATEVMLGQAAEVAGWFEAAGLVDVERHRDYAGIERVVSGRAG